MAHTEYQDLLAARALDALDPSDVRALEEHLASCDECRAELVELCDATSLIAHSAPWQEPGAHVRAKILASVKAEASPIQPPRTSAQVVQMPQRANRTWQNFLRMAAAIAFVALLVGVVVLWRRDARMRSEMGHLSQQLDAQNNEIQKNRELVARQQEALTLLNSLAAIKVPLSGTQTAPNARATFVFDKQTGRAVLMTEGLPVTSTDKAYEVWFIPRGQ